MSPKSYFVVLVLSGCLLTFLLAATAVSAQESAKSKVERGKYFVTLGGCHDCHSPKLFSPEGIPMPDETKLLSGHPADEKLPELRADMTGPGKWILFNDGLTAAVGPWGMSFASNLTPDPQFGIGLWTEDIFIEAMRTGKHMGSGRPILPPMPWFNLRELSSEDLGAIFAYLKSLPPIKNQVPTPRSPEELVRK
jgi:mono/diheme cytochrome c family protein